MIRAVFFRADDGHFKGFSFDGHAGLAAYGEDILCAAMSTLGQVTIASTMELLGLKPEYTIDEELGQIRLEPLEDEALDPRTEDDLSLLIENCLLGVKMAQLSYPERIRWTIEPTREDKNVSTESTSFS